MQLDPVLEPGLRRVDRQLGVENTPVIDVVVPERDVDVADVDGLAVELQDDFVDRRGRDPLGPQPGEGGGGRGAGSRVGGGLGVDLRGCCCGGDESCEEERERTDHQVHHEEPPGPGVAGSEGSA